ncbi:MAG: cell division ATP-binding protein FtsE [Deltaproteobacteria bacterium]|nr:cell division ATP-binding protein FtsE [Deltaproteobacteria bacterium]
MIHLRGVRKTYPPSQTALHKVDLRVKEGDFLFLVGASGAGKSTLLKLLFGAQKSTDGEVIVGGRNLSKITNQKLAYFRREIGIVFQDYKLLTRRTVLDNVAFPLEIRGVHTSKRKELATSILDAVGLGDRVNAMPLTLSGGEQQRVAIARALITRPKLLLADEPTGNLDPAMSRVVLGLLLEAHKCGTTVIVATHNLPLIEDLNLRTLVLDRGKVIGDFDGPAGVA